MRRPARQRFIGIELIVLVCLIGVKVIPPDSFTRDNLKAAILHQVVKVDVDNLDAIRFLAEHYSESDQLQEALSMYQKVARLEPNSAAAQLKLGNVAWGANCLDQALVAYENAVQLDPDDTWAQMCLAFAYRDRGRFQEAIGVFKNMIEREPETSDLHVLLGDTYSRMEDVTQAIAAYQEAITINPHNDQAIAKLRQLQPGS